MPRGGGASDGTPSLGPSLVCHRPPLSLSASVIRLVRLQLLPSLDSAKTMGQ